MSSARIKTDTKASKDGLVAEAKAGILAERSRIETERERLTALISRHQKTLNGIKYVGTGEFLRKIGGMLAETINRTDGSELKASVSGPYGMSPEWYLSLTAEEDDCWAIIRTTGGIEDLRIADGQARTRGITFPDDLSALEAIMRTQHDADVAERAAAAGKSR